MTPLEAARQMLERGVIGHCMSYGDHCAVCGTYADAGLHTDDCPSLALPKIVAALEAAERLLEKTGPNPYIIPPRMLCRICHFEGPDWTHTDWCAWAALRKALEA